MSTERASSKKYSSRRPSSKSNSQGSDITDILKLSAIAVAISLLGVIVLSFFTALIAFKAKDPLSIVTPVSSIFICLTSLSSGLIGMKLCKKAPLTTGLISGAMLTVFILAVALFLRSEVSPQLSTGARVLMHIIPIPLSAAGAFIGDIKPVKRHRRTRLRR